MFSPLIKPIVPLMQLLSSQGLCENQEVPVIFQQVPKTCQAKNRVKKIAHALSENKTIKL